MTFSRLVNRILKKIKKEGGEKLNFSLKPKLQIAYEPLLKKERREGTILSATFCRRTGMTVLG